MLHSTFSYTGWRKSEATWSCCKEEHSSGQASQQTSWDWWREQPSRQNEEPRQREGSRKEREGQQQGEAEGAADCHQSLCSNHHCPSSNTMAKLSSPSQKTAATTPPPSWNASDKGVRPPFTSKAHCSDTPNTHAPISKQTGSKEALQW